MSRTGIFLLLPVALGLGAAPDRPDAARQVSSDVQLRAMADELARSKTLQLNNLDKPYFIQYSVSDNQQYTASASLGGLISSDFLHVRQPVLQVRVGDYAFDNTNSIFSGAGRFGLFPVDDDYRAMRGNLWLSTDALYKGASDQIARKRAVLREIAEPDTTPDFSRALPAQVIEPPAGALKLNSVRWETTLRQASAKFAQVPAVTSSAVRVRVISSTYRMLNSEGTIIRVPQLLSDVGVLATAYAPDGSRVWNHAFATALVPGSLPSPAEVSAMAQRIAEETKTLTEAPAAEDYTGPVLFAGEAAPEMVAQVLTDTVRLPRKPVAPPGANAPEARVIDSVWSARVGAKVLPEWMSLVDDPLQAQANGQELVGHYTVDDEGVLAQRVALVDKGVLKTFLFSREPVRKFAASNGHGRLPGGFGSSAAVIGNLFVQADGGVSEAELKTRLQEKVKAAGLPFGILIRKLDFPSTANLQELESLVRQAQKGGFSRTLNPPILAFKVFPDGREELVRGLRFREFSSKDLRDIAAAGSVPYVLNYVNNGSSFNLAGAGSDATTSSVICPALLFDNVELAKAENEGERAPIVPPPPVTQQVP